MLNQRLGEVCYLCVYESLQNLFLHGIWLTKRMW